MRTQKSTLGRVLLALFLFPLFLVLYWQEQLP